MFSISSLDLTTRLGALFLVFLMVSPSPMNAKEIDSTEYKQSGKLTAGAYGAPLGASLEEVVLWGENNNFDISVNDHPTEEKIREQIDVHSSRIDRIKFVGFKQNKVPLPKVPGPG